MCTIDLYVLQVVHTAKRHSLSSKMIARGDPLPPRNIYPFIPYKSCLTSHIKIAMLV